MNTVWILITTYTILECNIEYSNFFSNPKFSKSIILMLVLRMHNSRFSFNEKLEPKHCCAAAHACILIKHENFLLNCNLNQIRLSTSHSSSAEHVFAEKIPSLPATIFPWLYSSLQQKYIGPPSCTKRVAIMTFALLPVQNANGLFKREKKEPDA